VRVDSFTRKEIPPTNNKNQEFLTEQINYHVVEHCTHRNEYNNNGNGRRLLRSPPPPAAAATTTATTTAQVAATTTKVAQMEVETSRAPVTAKATATATTAIYYGCICGTLEASRRFERIGGTTLKKPMD